MTRPAVFGVPIGPAVFDDLVRRVHVVLAWDTADGRRAGDVVEAFECPDCRVVELCEFTLNINHGWARYSPRPCEWSDRPMCTLQLLLHHQGRTLADVARPHRRVRAPRKAPS